MFMPKHITNISNHTGTQSILLVFGENPTNAEKISSPRPNTSVGTSLLISPYQLEAVIPTLHSWCSTLRIEVLVCSTQSCFHSSTSWCCIRSTQCDSTLRIKIRVRSESFTVQALYEGLLVTIWTTAQTRQQRWSCSAQLATLLVLFATLTIVGRCYAAPLVQLYPRPFHDSIRPTSNLVLSRLFSPDRDTRIIRDEVIRLDQNTTIYRSRRGLEPFLRNRISKLRSKLSFAGNSTTIKNSRTGRYEQLSAREGEGSVYKTRVTLNNTLEREDRQNDSSFPGQGLGVNNTLRPMPPAHAQDDESPGVVGFFNIIFVVLLVAGLILGLVTCLTSYHWATGGTSGADTPATHPHNAADTPTTAPMLSVVSAGAAAGMGGMDRLRGGRTARELAAARDRQVRLQSVHRDIALNLPHSIALPDGEEHSFASSRLHIRDSEQEAEIYQKCIRPPPNRTVLETELPPPYRSNSAGMLPSSSSSSSSSSSGSDWSSSSGPLVVRCHSMSSSSKTMNSNHPSSVASAAAGQKTDFLQRTVKIFTGGKKTTTNQPPPAPTLPAILVPVTSRTQRAAASRSKPPPGV